MRSESGLARFTDRHVVVVDDDPFSVELLTALLHDEGLRHVTGLTDPRLVIGLLATTEVDLVLLDLHMPHVNGQKVLEQIARVAAGSYLPVLVLTADTGLAARDSALSNGAMDFVTKPFDVTELLLRTANLLETRELFCTRGLTADANPRVTPTVTDLRTRERIRAALAESSVEAVFQPVVAVDTLAVVGHEALSRFPTDDGRGPIGWFADAEGAGLRVDLERLAAEKAMPFFDASAAATFLAVNLSPATLLDTVAHPLFPPGSCSRLVVELTEYVPVHDYPAVGRAMVQLREQGARLAVDDLGAGYAGFHHLVALAPDIIKLDLRLIAGIDGSTAQQAMVRALLAFAMDVDAVVLAEGVSRREELTMLRDLGMPWAQGFLLGRPQAMSALVPSKVVPLSG